MLIVDNNACEAVSKKQKKKQFKFKIFDFFFKKIYSKKYL